MAEIHEYSTPLLPSSGRLPLSFLPFQPLLMPNHMSLESLPRIAVDFNELVGADLVLLATEDCVKCEDGSELMLQVGLPVIAVEYNANADGTAEYRYVRGHAERNDPAVNGEWTRKAQWCCRFSGGVQSDLFYVGSSR